MNKKTALIITIFLVVVALVAVTRFFSGDEEVNVPNVKEEELELGTVKVYFSNSNIDPEFTCEKVFPVERKIIASKDMYYEAAVTELLNGPSEEDVEQGYGTGINSNVMIQKIEFVDGVVTVDFNEQMDFQMGGSCRVLIIRKQIEETLKQFPEVKEVVISIDGRTEDILQP